MRPSVIIKFVVIVGCVCIDHPPRPPCTQDDRGAQDCFDGYSVMFNTRGDAHRRGRSADKAAEEGIAPWKIGMLAACLCMWDTMWGVRARRV